MSVVKPFLEGPSGASRFAEISQPKVPIPKTEHRSDEPEGIERIDNE
jgi:hypothetical protein